MSAAVIVGPGEGESTHERFKIKAGLEQLVVVEFRHEPGKNEPDPHIHHHHADSFYVLEGEMEFLVRDDFRMLKQGEVIFAPPGFVHTFRNRGPNPARTLNLHAPGLNFDRHLMGDRSFEFDQHQPPEDGGLPLSAGIAGRDGRRIQIGDSEGLILVNGDDGIGSVTVMELTLAPGYAGPPPHLHERHVESFYLLEGTVTVRLGDEEHEASAGDYVLIPPGNVHTAWNRGDAPAKALNVVAPGGLERYAMEMAATDDPAERAEIASKYDVRFVE